MSTYTGKIGDREVTFLKMTKNECNAMLRAISSAKNIKSAWRELTGVIGVDESSHIVSCMFGDGEGTIADPAKYAADFAALMSEIPNTITKDTAARFTAWAQEIAREHLPVVDKRETPEQHAATIAERNATMQKHDDERTAARRAFAAKYAESDQLQPTPEGMQAVVIELNYNDSDSMSDYFDRHHSYGETMVIGYLPKNARRTEANARAMVARYPELTALSWTWNTENYSMGHGNWLESGVVTQADDVTTYGGYSKPACWWEVSQDGGYSAYSKGYLPFRGFTQANNPPTPKAPAPKQETTRNESPAMFISRGDGYEVTHEREWTWLKFPSKPTPEVLDTLRANGGRFSGRRVAWYFTRHLSESEIRVWLGYESPAEGDSPSPAMEETPSAPAVNPLPAMLRQKADNMQKEIDNKLNPASGNQNFTERRARIAAGMRAEGYHLEKIQTALRALASAHEAGTIPASLKGVTSKKAIDALLYKNDPELTALIEGKTPDREAEEKRRELETEARRLVGLIPGYFPTPKPVIIQMMSLAGVQEGDKLLEPEAGAGAIAEEARARGAEVDTVEINYTLRDVLAAKGFNPIGYDFLEMSPNGTRYNKIVMNPPFERFQDIDHVRHAFQFLEDGGRMVSVMSESVFFRDDQKPREFREWLSGVGYDMDLPAGAFQESGTGVKTRLVIIDK